MIQPIGQAKKLDYENEEIPFKLFAMKKDSKDLISIPHWHDDFELVYVIDGAEEYRINDDKLILQKGDVLFINTRVLHYTTCASESASICCINFQPSILTGNAWVSKTVIEPIWKINPLEYVYFPRTTGPAIYCAKYMVEIMKAVQEHPDDHYLVSISRLLLIMDKLRKELAERNPVIQQNTQMGEIEKTMISFIYHRFSDKITLQDIADSAHINIHTCCDIFKHYLGVSPMKYLNTFRLEMAHRLLQTSQATVDHIAYSCGFDSTAYFIKQFKEKYGITPKKFQTSNSQK